uniref:Uncharacterized protein MANES_01G175200 n=1 Tax=Rhizophora mucronata TaxID=61149 RepID=A0A2P2L703_RHIMU
MQSIKQITKSTSPRALILPSVSASASASASSSYSCAAILGSANVNGNNFNITNPQFLIFFYCNHCYYNSAAYATAVEDAKVNGSSLSVVGAYFKEWFKKGRNASLNDGGEPVLLERIYEILSNGGGGRGEEEQHTVGLSQLGLRLSEKFVLEVLSYGRAKNDVLFCLRFFDWVGHQKGFHHTRNTFYAIFKILSRAKLMPLVVDFLDKYMAEKFIHHKFGFYSVLVIGYALAGKPMFALQLFGRMRFMGLDLDAFSYHVLLSALVEEGCFEAVEAISNQILARGFQKDVTHSVIVKSFCKQKLFDQAESYLRRALLNDQDRGFGDSYGYAVSFLVDALCKDDQFEKARNVIDVYIELGEVPVEPAYDAWFRNLAQSGKLGEALEFLQKQKSFKGYVPGIFRYNGLLLRLLKEDHLEEACDLLTEMIESQISPDAITMNAALRFFCKAGMVDVALDLYNSRSDFGISPNTMTYNCLINALLGDGSTDEAYRVLRNSAGQGYFPGRRTFIILADALCREGKLDKMKELLLYTLEQNFIPSDSTYDKFISALCRAGRVEDGYMIHKQLCRINRVAKITTYVNLINGFRKLCRGDIAARLLLEMQDKGYDPRKPLVRSVIECLCHMENPELHFFKLLGMQLSHREPNCYTYNFFISGAGYAKRPDLGRQVFEMMERSGILPNVISEILMLQCFLKSQRISDALNFLDVVRHRRGKIGKRLYNTMVVGLCKANKVDLALDFLKKMLSEGLTPSIYCFEELVSLLCSSKRYDTVIHLIDELGREGRCISSFIGNQILLHAFNGDELHKTWIRYKEAQSETSYGLSVLGQLIGSVSTHNRLSQQVYNLDEVIDECFPPDTFTYNLLLRKLCISDVDHACELFNRMCQKGHEPNRWTYDVMVRSLFKQGRVAEADRWMMAMDRGGFHLIESPKRFSAW